MLVNINQEKNWSKIAKHLPGRIGKQCRERWYNHLNPSINKEPWAASEDRIIVEVCISILILLHFAAYVRQSPMYACIKFWAEQIYSSHVTVSQSALADMSRDLFLWQANSTGYYGFLGFHQYLNNDVVRHGVRR